MIFPTKIEKNYLSAIILFLLCSISIFAQVTSTTSGLRATSDEVAKAEAKVNIITSDSGRYFKQGLINLVDNRRPQARADFDKSIEVFLHSNVNVRKNQKLSDCYDQLIETIYLMEFPSAKSPANIQLLAKTCGWDISIATVEAVVKLTVPASTQSTGNSDLVTSVIDSTKAANLQTGFSEQKFEAAKGEKLAQLEFWETEKIDKPKSTNSNQQIPKSKNLAKNSKPVATKDGAGTKPQQKATGEVPIVMNWFQNNLNDPYSMKIVNWGNVVKVGSGADANWAVIVKLRAKNLYGAYVLGQYTFFIRQNKIVKYLVS
jgi:hypothetical protein